jgi:hypothetical protein
VFAALWKLGLLQSHEQPDAIASPSRGRGIAISVSKSGTKEQIQIDRK